MTQRENVKKLGKNESYKCPFPHPHPRHEMAFFKDFDSHFRTFEDSDDHFEVVRLQKELLWKLRCSEAEKRSLSQDDLGELSMKAWLEAIKKNTGKEIQVVQKK